MNDRVTMTPAEALVGRVIAGKYKLLEKPGAGAMGAVYKATDAQGNLCAVKVMEATAVSNPALRERFEREAKALELVKHPNVLEIRDFGVDAGLPFLVMELLEGRTLEEMVVEHTPDPATGIELAKDVLRGLGNAHAAGVLHRDLKSENVFVVWDGQRWRCKLLDFGLVKFEGDQAESKKKLTMHCSMPMMNFIGLPSSESHKRSLNISGEHYRTSKLILAPVRRGTSADSSSGSGRLVTSTRWKPSFICSTVT